MKKVLIVLMTLLMVLSVVGCSKKEPEPVEPDPIVDVDPEPEPEPEPIVYRNPLTGEVTEEDISNKRPIAVMHNTIYQALPQSGNSKADIYIEMCEEGGISRVMGLYQDIEGVGKLGSIRSCREYFLAWCMSLDALIVHDGGDTLCRQATANIYRTLDAAVVGSSVYYRDQNRMQYLAYEHTEYTSSDRILGYLENSSIRQEHEEGYKQIFTFGEDATPSGKDATKVRAEISGYKNTVFKYDESTQRYKVYFWDDEPYIDESYNNTQIEVTNVLILTCYQYTKYPANDKARQAYAMDSGTGYYISGGKCAEVKFTKADYNVNQDYGAGMVITYADGSPLVMNIGKTYIIMMSDSNTIAID